MTPTPTALQTDPTSQLLAFAKNIETYRADLGTSKAVLLRDYPELGSDKTYGKIINGNLGELDTEKWAAAYEHVWQQIQHDDQGADEGLIENLSAPVELCRSYLETRNEKGNARFILILADTGMGKSSAIKVMQSKPYGGLMVVVEASDAWKGPKGTSGPLLHAIGTALGMHGLTTRRDALLNDVMNKLRGQRRCLVIEEAHHLCPQGLNTIKTLINLTPVIVVATAIPVLWERVAGSKAAWAEVKQLVGNRLAERIVLTLGMDDVMAFLERRGVNAWLNAADMKKAAARLVEEARGFGNMKFIDRATTRFKREVAKGQDATLETFTNAIAQEKKRR
ncbi:AAA family ATPase [Prosthecobacter sp.]|uniref:AAA family ATPase n=1 Tax=Prosthecobacter sp. TaxID=1965333 RepID=UPI003784D561